MNNLEQAIQDLIDTIDISDAAYKQAEERYQAIGKWLQRDESKLLGFSPDVYTQGSFALGTVIKPLDGSEDYDIDLVCQLKAGKSQFTQKQIKSILGKEILSYVRARRLLNEPEQGKRCWTMIYESSLNSPGFHLDALPAISCLSYTEAKKKYDCNQNYDIFRINITDNERDNYEKISNDWNVSNPKGYAEWFHSRQETRMKQIILEQTEDVPVFAVKTPLQRTIQFLKRHRDIYFQDCSDIKPISIIITTLVAQTHIESNTKIIEIIHRFMEHHSSYITPSNATDVDWIANPVNGNENFADKWEDFPERKRAFHDWIEKLRQDLLMLSSLPVRGNPETYIKRLLIKSEDNAKYVKSKENLPAVDFDVPHKKSFQFPTNSAETVSITARYREKGGGFRRKVLRSGQSIEKGIEITFKVNVGKHFRGRKKYYWQVVNTGAEAILIKKNPRGDFYAGEPKRGGKTRIENTAYVGTHWVQCFVVQNDKCIAKSPEFLVNIH